MTFQPWIHPRRDVVVRHNMTFNGAMTFQPWILQRPRLPTLGLKIPLMEP